MKIAYIILHLIFIITFKLQQQLNKGFLKHSNCINIKMSKQFFTELANQLCNMKDSPFMRIGEKIDVAKSQLLQKRTLSFDPDRMFNPDKYSERQKLMDESYIKFQQQQKQVQLQIEYDLLKRNTNEQYQKEVQKMKLLQRTDHKQPYSMFGVYRGACRLCGKCQQYQGCFSNSQKFAMSTNDFIENTYNVSSFASSSYSSNFHTEIMQCYKCKCPMNSHIKITEQPVLRGQIFKHLTSLNIQDGSLNSSHIVVSFKIPQNEIKNYHTIIQILNNLNCRVVNYKVQSKLNFELGLIKANIIENSNTDTSYIQSLLNLLQSIKLQKQWKWAQRNNKQIHINQVYEELYDIIRKIGAKIEGQLQIEDGYCVIVLLCKYEVRNVNNLMRYLSRNDRAQSSRLQYGSSNNRNNLGGSTASTVSSLHNNYYSSSEQFNQFKQLQEKHNIKFIHSTQTNKQSIIFSQYFFKQNYQIHYNIFMLPSGSLHSSESGTNVNEQEYNNYRFKDILDYNNYIVFVQNFKDMERVKLQQVMSKILKFRGIKINYILGQQLLNDRVKKLALMLTAKLGLPNLHVPFENFPDFITVANTNRMQIPKTLSLIYPQFIYSQRCIFVIRPFVINSGFEEIIINLLRINKFILLKRIRIKLSQSQASYLATIEGISDDFLSQYIKYMTAGVCEIVLTSKRSAIYQGFALSHGCMNGVNNIASKSMRNTEGGTRLHSGITVQIKKGREVYQEQLPIYQNNCRAGLFGNNTGNQVFKSVREIIDIEKVLFGYGVPSQYSVNTRNREITRIDPTISHNNNNKATSNNINNNNNSSQPIPVTHKIKQSMLKELKKDNFNYWLFSSKSQTLTQQIAGVFLPQCTLFQPITVLVKPGLTHLVPLIRKCLAQHKYHIITQKQIQMNKTTALQFIYNCQKIKIENEMMKKIIQSYSKQRAYLFCLSKISGRKQIMSMLSGFSFIASISQYQQSKSNSTSQKRLQSKQAQDIFIEDQYISDQMLCDILVPVWNNEELCLRMISEPLANLEESIKIIQENQLQLQQQLQKEKEIKNQKTQKQQAVLKPNHNNNRMSKIQKYIVMNYLVGSFYGVSIDDLQLNTKLGKLTYYIAQQIEAPKLQSWYYYQVSSIKPNYVPLLFQYRQIGQSMVCIQSYKGVPFMDKIIEMYEDEEKKMKALELKDQDNFLSKKKNKRRSLVLFLWAKKLVQLCIELSQVTCQLKDFGEIGLKNSQHRGSLTLQQAYKQQLNFLSHMLHDFEEHSLIKANIKKLLDSRHLKQRYTQKSKRLLPSFVLSALQQCIRVLQKTQTSKLQLMDLYTFIDPDNEASKLKDLYCLHLFNILPEIRTKYSMLAEVYYFLVKVELQNPQLSQIIAQLCNIFADLLSDHADLDVIQYQIYLRFLIQFVKLSPQQPIKGTVFNMLKLYPNFRQNKKIDRDQAAGKKRKYLQHNHYFKRKYEENITNKQIIQKKFLNFDVNTLIQKPKQSILYNPDDPLHYRFAHAEKRINLLREPKQQEQQQKGVYVQFEKNITQKEQILKEKIKQEVQKFNYHNQTEILHETGLQKDLWYRRTKGDTVQKAQSKTKQAIDRQIQKLMSFKKEQAKKNK